MDRQFGEVDESVNLVAGFEVPRSPDSSYNNPIPGREDDMQAPMFVPPHLQHTLLSYSARGYVSNSLPSPWNAILNHLYIEKHESPRSVVALGFTHRFRSKYVTVILHKPIQTRVT
ncbi:SNF1-related protein kinase regulatory subunit beta-2 [Zostera marina]|uniref:SNF1-related protein kinase regulatory subunit beta-2 n=1 Tax=Zostera marina TaxID=29655 RepID=A0A0K9P4W0_ZOSMR|nr:SNF1-related protein kinase regulatory subunit beta-2 [Zostera marina]